MNAFNSPFMALPGIGPEELTYLQQATTGLSDQQVNTFMMVYSGKRRNPQDMLLYGIIGLCIVPGLQRFILGQIGMGILYLCTLGLCFIGSIVDLVNHSTMANEYNKRMAFESLQMIRLSNG